MRRINTARMACVLAALAGAGTPARAGDGPAADRPAGAIEVVARFDGPMPTGVTVSHAGQIFVGFPRWDDKVESTVAEVRAGRVAAHPDEEINRVDRGAPSEHPVSVQSAVVDPKDRLWAVDGRMADSQVGATILDLGEKGASDGLESDDRGRLYATDYFRIPIDGGPVRLAR